MKPHFVPVFDLKNQKENRPFGGEIEGVQWVGVLQNDQYSVFDGRCPHQGTSLMDGSIEAGNLVCPAHQWAFDCTTGERTGARHICLHKFSSQVKDGQLFLDLHELRTWKAEQSGTAEHTGPLKKWKDLPGPKGLPLIGNMHQIPLQQVHLQLEQWAEEFGEMYRVQIPGTKAIAVSSSKLIRHILKERPHAFRRLNKMEEVSKEMGVNGVFASEGEDWKRQRYFSMQALSAKQVRSFFPVVTDVTERLFNRWQGQAATGNPIEVQKDLMRFTVDITTRIAFGYDMNTLEKDSDTIQEHLELVFPMLSRRIFIPIPYWRLFRLPIDRRLDKALARIRSVVDEYIALANERIQNQPELKTAPSNFLEALLVAEGEDGSRFSDEEIFANVFTMLLAGEDTTANSLAWMCHYLVEHPEVQERVQQEVDLVLGDDRFLTDMEQAKKLRYTGAVAHEAMRLMPVAPALFIDAIEDTELGGVEVPAGTSLFLLIRRNHMREEQFRGPSSFFPDRWLNGSNALANGHHPSFFPFGSGPRVCPGRNLALVEIQTALAMIARNFTLSRPDPYTPPEETMTFTLYPKNLQVMFTPRT